MAASKEVIDSTAAVTAKLNAGGHQQHKQSMVRRVMKHDMGMTYKKIKAISLHENSIRNLVLRQQFALKYLDAF